MKYTYKKFKWNRCDRCGDTAGDCDCTCVKGG